MSVTLLKHPTRDARFRLPIVGESDETWPWADRAAAISNGWSVMEALTKARRMVAWYGHGQRVSKIAARAGHRYRFEVTGPTPGTTWRLEIDRRNGRARLAPAAHL
jgi:hypothetical protein